MMMNPPARPSRPAGATPASTARISGDDAGVLAVQWRPSRGGMDINPLVFDNSHVDRTRRIRHATDRPPGRGDVDEAARRLWDRYFDQLVHLAHTRLRTAPRGLADEE